jgi:hypothetical protein
MLERGEPLGDNTLAVAPLSVVLVFDTLVRLPPLKVSCSSVPLQVKGCKRL